MPVRRGCSFLRNFGARISAKMMMAHDSGPGPSVLAAETIEALRSALEQYVDAPLHGSALKLALQTMAKEAHAKSILPEQLLVVLKDVWHTLPSVRSMNEPADQARLLQRVVTMCIKEYYAD
jgi:hypothetical protein